MVAGVGACGTDVLLPEFELLLDWLLLCGRLISGNVTVGVVMPMIGISAFAGLISTTIAETQASPKARSVMLYQRSPALFTY